MSAEAASPQHALGMRVLGAGTGNTVYLATCVCGWSAEDHNAMNAYDRATLHELTAQR